MMEINRPTAYDKDLSIMILHWNVDELLERCLSSIIQNGEGVTYDIAIADNNSEGDGWRRVRQKFSHCTNITWIENSQNIGGLAINQLQKYCTGKYLLFLGPDAELLPGCIQEMVSFLDKSQDAGAVTAKLLDPDGSPQSYYYKLWNIAMLFFHLEIGRRVDERCFKGEFAKHFYSQNLDPSRLTIVEQPAGACFMFKREAVGQEPLADKRFPFFFDDVDICKRIHDNGWRIYLLPTAEAIHHGQASFRQTDPIWREQEFRRSAVRYFEKHHKLQAPLARVVFFINDLYERFKQFQDRRNRDRVSQEHDWDSKSKSEARKPMAVIDTALTGNPVPVEPVMPKTFADQEARGALTPPAPVIDDFGPRVVKAGVPFNLQPSGKSALWFSARHVTWRTIVVFDNHELRTEVARDGRAVTAIVPADLVQESGQYAIHLFDKQWKQKSEAVMLRVE